VSTRIPELLKATPVAPGAPEWSYIAGMRVVENRMMRWDQIYVFEDAHLIICGERGYVVHVLFMAAWREMVHRDHEKVMQQLRDLARRAGVE
jgi:hypothetical protein